MSRVILVRHALSVADPDVDSRQWGLADGAVAEAERLASALPDDISGPVWTSTETKAISTARAIARVRSLDVATDERFGEVVRPWSDGDYRSLAKRYLERGVVECWEPADDVRARFGAALDAVLSDGGDVVVVNHGLAMSLHVASVTNVDVAAFWTSLTFPDAWSLASGAVAPERLFTAGRPAPDQT